MHLVLTRSKKDNDETVSNKEFQALLQKHNDLKIIKFPCVEYHEAKDYSALDEALRKNHEYDWIIFLSTRAAESFFNRLIKIGGNLFNLAPHIKIACIGPKTQKFITDTIGFPVDFMPSRFNTEELFKEFSKEFENEFQINGKPILPKKKVLIPRVSQTDKSFIKNLESINLEVIEAEAYLSKCPSQDDPEIKEALSVLKNAAGNKEDISIIFTSPEIVKNFAALISSINLKSQNIKVLSIGPKTTEAIKEYFPKLELFESEQSTIESLIGLVKGFALN